jgi:hypothetical protein
MTAFLDVERFEANTRQRWGSYLAIIASLALIAAGFALRSRDLNATQRVESTADGIAARYPAGWLVEVNDTVGQPGAARVRDFVFRIQDPAALPFKTTLQVSLLPVGPDATIADIPDQINLTRANGFNSYRVLQIQTVRFGERPAISLEYAYVEQEANPFLQSLPVVVRGIDVITVRSSQAILITFRAESQSFERNRPYFDTFLRSLSF